MGDGTKELKEPSLSTLDDVSDEVYRARAKHPSPTYLLAALMEEVGELSKAFIEDAPWDHVREEAKQVACVAIRIMEEGDPSFPVKIPPGRLRR